MSDLHPDVLEVLELLERATETVVEGALGRLNDAATVASAQGWITRQEFWRGGPITNRPDGYNLLLNRRGRVRLAEYRLAAEERDTKNDTPKKNRKRREPSTDAFKCARAYKRNRGRVAMKTVVKDYAEANGKSAASILRELADNPEIWKKTTKKRQKNDT